jgi:hypothetical protein
LAIPFAQSSLPPDETPVYNLKFIQKIINLEFKISKKANLENPIYL